MSRRRAIGGSELARVRLLFGLLGIVPVFLALWLGWVQVAQAGQLRRDNRPPLRLVPAAVDAQSLHTETLPAPRGTILDRHGATLAVDCEAYEVRAVVCPPRSARVSRAALSDYLESLATDLVSELARDPLIADKAAFRREERAQILARLHRAFGFHALHPSGRLPEDAVPARADVLVGTDVSSSEAAAGLRAVDSRRASIVLDWLRTHQRVYPDRDSTWGLVGFEQALPVRGDAGELVYERHGIVGIERIAALEPGQAGVRHFALDAAVNAFWAGPPVAPSPPSVLHTTIDLELQKAAMRVLDAQARQVGTDGRSRLPLWGALVLVEIESGDVLAAASWHRDAQHPKGTAFTPYQLLCEPGSIVKPLVFAWALQYAGLDWHRVFDCTSSGSKNERVVEETGRLVRDEHRCGALTPHGILVNSSNIGAVKVGSLLTREQWREWFEFHGFGRSLGLGLPHEVLGGPHRASFDPSVSTYQFRRWSGSSFSIGYQLQVNAMQMARAYLSMLSGRKRGLRLFQAVELDGGRIEAPRAPSAPRQFSPAVVEMVAEAMTDVVAADPHSTGRHLHALLLREEGLDAHGLIAGKTGTAASQVGTGQGKVEMRNAGFVGFAPAGRPRYLAVCFLQRDDDARFYGGSYAAPPVARLLLQSLRLEERRRPRLEPQVGVTPGDQAGAGGAPETTPTGGR